MNILHGTWIPQTDNSFIQTGGFYLWAETTQPQKSRKARTPHQLAKVDLAQFLAELDTKAPAKRL